MMYGEDLGEYICNIAWIDIIFICFHPDCFVEKNLHSFYGLHTAYLTPRVVKFHFYHQHQCFRGIQQSEGCHSAFPASVYKHRAFINSWSCSLV